VEKKMKIPLQITARNFDLTDVIRNEIYEKAEKLDNFYGGIMRCRVIVETPHRRQRDGVLYNVRIDMTVPGSELMIKREPHEDLYAAIRNSFDAAYRRLEEFARQRRGDVKRHEESAYARVSALFPDKGYGFLTTPEGREIYFHKNSVLNRKFNRLKVGTEVRFIEEVGEKGPQASTVSLV
jgi:ribosomal subunit interface protein